MAKLDIPLGQIVGSLSGGQRAQVALALALAKRPELLVLDEPVASLDPVVRREFLQTLMESVAESGFTVLLSSHLIGDLERVCDFLVLLTQAEVRLVGEIDELLASHRVLVGPRTKLSGVAGVASVVQASHTDRQTTVLARMKSSLHDPAFASHEIDLEELVLAYMGQAPTRLHSAPEAEGIEANR